MKWLPLLLGLLLPLFAAAQGSAVPLGNRAYDILDRLEVRTGERPAFHSTLKPYLRRDVLNYAVHLDTSGLLTDARDRADLRFLYLDNLEWLARRDSLDLPLGAARRRVYVDEYFYTYAEPSPEAEERLPRPADFRNAKPFLKYFYDTPGNFFAVDRPGFQFRLDPLLDFKLYPSSGDEEGTFFRNLRGLEIRGGVDDRLYFYTNLEIVETRLPDYVNARIARDRALPGAGLYKPYESRIFDIDNGFSYLNSQAYLGFNITKSVGLQFGHGRNFIGNGYRSLLLSDFGANYLYLKLNWRIWKFHYQNLYTDLSAFSANFDRGDRELPSKYMTAHYLDYRVNDKWSVGIYEAVIFNRQDQFELHYLNPVILYRTVEQFVGSPDNVLLGLNTKYNLAPGVQLYGQLVVDEFKFDKLFFPAAGEEGWWANKYGVQVGAKLVDPLGVEGLSVQAEFNNGRPYLYSHRDTTGNSYSHYNQPLAHPLGANFREWLLRARYRFGPKLWADVRYLDMRYGEDIDGANYGGNILLSHRTRVQDFGNEIGQGEQLDVRLIGLDLTYQLYHGLYAELQGQVRNAVSDRNSTQRTVFVGGGLRLNVGRYRSDF